MTKLNPLNCVFEFLKNVLGFASVSRSESVLQSDPHMILALSEKQDNQASQSQE